MRKLQPLSSQAGLSLIEMLVTIAIAGIVMMVIMGLISPLLKLANRMDTTTGLHLVANLMRGCIRNDVSWQATVNDTANTSLTCLRNRVPCPNNNVNGFIRLRVSEDPTRSLSDNLCIKDYDPIGDGTMGFTKTGQVCTGFTPLGNDDCPFRLNTKFIGRCPFGEPGCANPLVFVEGNFEHKPRTPDASINLSRFNFSIIRGRADPNKSFILRETYTTTGTPGGACTGAGGGAYRSFTEVYDPGQYVLALNPPTRIRLEPGTYECLISVPGFQVGNHKAVLMDLNRNVPLLHGTSEYAPDFWSNSVTRSEIVGTFSLPQATTVGVFHRCSTIPPVTSPRRNQTMGVPAGYGPEIYSEFRCNVLTGWPN